MTIEPWPLLGCPACGGRLVPGESVGCAQCGARFPLVDGIPWLAAPADDTLGAWRSQLRAHVSALGTQSALYRASAGTTTTVLAREKTLRRVDARDAITGLPIAGYEIHLGETWSNEAPLLSLDGTPEGARSEDGRVFGSYIHGLFASDQYRAAFLRQVRARADSGLAYEARIDATLDALADHIAKAVDLDRLLELAR